MGLFSSYKTIKTRNLDKILKKVKILDRAEREYIKGVFQQYKSGGISKSEVEKVIRNLKWNTSDNIDSKEAEAIKKELLKYL